jgi:hypothetical protein
MSKTELKKHLQSLSKEQVIEQVLELYDNCKPAKEYFEYLLNPNEKEQFKKFKAIIINEFYPKGNRFNPSLRFSVAKKAIADFRSLKPSPELLADLLVTQPEIACQFTGEYGDMSEQYYNSTVINFEIALKFLLQNDLLPDFKLRCKDCEKYAEPCGYGFPDEISQLFYEYYG